MARDRKRRPRRRGKGAGERRVWPWFFFGLVAGVGASAVVITGDFEVGDVGAAIERLIADDSTRDPATSQPVARAAPEKPRFEFYTMLPEMEVAVPEEELRAAMPEEEVRDSGPEEKPRATARAAPTAPPPPLRAPPKAAARATGAYLLQVGSFRSRKEAERLKAELALLGVQAAVQSVVIDGKNTWHRVRVGPYTDLRALNNDRVRLRENRREAIVLRIGSNG